MQNHFNINCAISYSYRSTHITIFFFFPFRIKYHLMDFYFCYLNNHRAIRQNNTVTAVNTLQTITKITFRYSFSEKTYKRCISPQEKFPKRYSKKQMIQRKQYRFGAIFFFFFFWNLSSTILHANVHICHMQSQRCSL